MINYQELFQSFNNSINSSRPVLFFIAIDKSLENDFDFEICMRHLPLTVQQRILNKRNVVDRHVKLVNLLILPFIVSLQRGSRNLVHLPLQYSEFGKPYMLNMGFNISDEANVVAMVVDFCGEKREMGLDLASIADINRFNSNLNQFLADFKDIFTPEELCYLHTLELHPAALQNKVLAHYWALKESYSKLRGSGLNESFQRFNFKDQVSVPLEQPRVEPIGIYKDLVLMHENFLWAHHGAIFQDEPDGCHNYTTQLTEDLVCSVFAELGAQFSGSDPLVIEIKLELLVEFLKSSQN